MDFSHFFDSQLFTYLVLPLLILIARVSDVTIGTIRIMFVTRGNKMLAPILGFFEILIWLVAIRQIMQNLENIFCYIAYAGGFAIGNFIGIKIEEKLAYGKVIIRVITKRDATKLVEDLKRKGFGFTKIDAEGSVGQVNVIYCIIDRLHLQKIINIINKHNPKAFYTVEDIRSVKEGIFPENAGRMKRFFFKPPKLWRRVQIYRRLFQQRKSK